MQRTWRRLRWREFSKNGNKRKSQPKWTDGPTPLLSLLTKRQSCRCFETILADSWLATRLYWFKTRCFVFFPLGQGPGSRGWNLCLIFPPRNSPNQTRAAAHIGSGIFTVSPETWGKHLSIIIQKDLRLPRLRIQTFPNQFPIQKGIVSEIYKYT